MNEGGIKKQRPEPLFFVGRPNGRAASFSDRDDDRGNVGCGRRGGGGPTRDSSTLPESDKRMSPTKHGRPAVVVRLATLRVLQLEPPKIVPATAGSNSGPSCSYGGNKPSVRRDKRTAKAKFQFHSCFCNFFI